MMRIINVIRKYQNKIATLFFIVVALICLSYRFIENWVLKRDYGYCNGYIIGKSFEPEGEPGMDFYYIVNGKRYDGTFYSNEIRKRRHGDKVLIKYFPLFPNVSTIVDTTTQ